MSITSDFAKPEGAEVDMEDRLGGSRTVPSDAYRVTLGQCYQHKSPKGAKYVHIEYTTRTGVTQSENIYYSNKDGETTFRNKSTGKLQTMPGWNRITALIEVATDKPSDQVITDKKYVGIYNADAKKEVETEVDVLVELTGKEVVLGILHVEANKTKAVKTGDPGDPVKYVPTAEKREYNEISVIADTRGRTKSERDKGFKTGEFIQQWRQKNKDTTRDLYKPVEGAPAATASSAPTVDIDFGD